MPHSLHSGLDHRYTAERRADPRLPVNLPVVLHHGRREVAGRARDLSWNGHGIELPGHCRLVRGPVEVEVALTSRSPTFVSAELVRTSPGNRGSTHAGLLLEDRDRDALRGTGAIARPPGRPADDERCPERRAALRQLRALGARAFELGLSADIGEAPPEALFARLTMLSAELRYPPPPEGSSLRQLLAHAAEVHARPASHG